MLILWDWENIQAKHYKKVKQLIVDQFGYAVWRDAIRLGAIAGDNWRTCQPNIFDTFRTFYVDGGADAADDKLVEFAAKHIGNRCIIISGDKILKKRITDARINARRRYVSERGLKKTKTYCVCFDKNRDLTISILPVFIYDLE